MSEMTRVFVNARPVDVPAGSTALDAVRAFDPVLGAGLAEGTRQVTDSRGLPIPADSPVYQGAIFRVLPVRRHGGAGATPPDDAEPDDARDAGEGGGDDLLH